MAVDYLTRFMLGTPVEEAFDISLKGAKIALMEHAIPNFSQVLYLLTSINGLDDISIDSACRLSGFDVCYRAGVSSFMPVSLITLNKETIENIKIMVNRSVAFLNTTTIIKSGFTFEGGYTAVIDKGDGDYLSKDTLFDIKVSKNPPTNKHTLQLLIYYLMGKHSIYKEFNNIKYLGIFNPRLNKSYTIKISDIPEEIIKTVSTEIIGYTK